MSLSFFAAAGFALSPQFRKSEFPTQVVEPAGRVAETPLPQPVTVTRKFPTEDEQRRPSRAVAAEVQYPDVEVKQLDTPPAGLEVYEDSTFYEITVGEATYVGSARTIHSEEIGAFETTRSALHAHCRPKADIHRDPECQEQQYCYAASGYTQLAEFTLLNNEGTRVYNSTTGKVTIIKRARPFRMVIPTGVIELPDSSANLQSHLLPEQYRQSSGVHEVTIDEEHAYLRVLGSSEYQLYGTEYVVTPNIPECLKDILRNLDSLELSLRASGALLDSTDEDRCMVECFLGHNPGSAGYYYSNTNQTTWNGDEGMQPRPVVAYALNNANKTLYRDDMLVIPHEMSHSANRVHNPDNSSQYTDPSQPDEGLSVFCEMLVDSTKGNQILQFFVRKLVSYLHDSNTMFADRGYQLAPLVWYMMNTCPETRDLPLTEVLTAFQKHRLASWSQSNFEDPDCDMGHILADMSEGKMERLSIQEHNKNFLLAALSGTLNQLNMPLLSQYKSFIQKQFNGTKYDDSDKVLERIAYNSEYDASWCVYEIGTHVSAATLSFYETESTIAEEKNEVGEIISRTITATPTAQAAPDLEVFAINGENYYPCEIDEYGTVELLAHIERARNSGANSLKVLVYNSSMQEKAVGLHTPLLLHLEKTEINYKQHMPAVLR